MTRKQNKRQLKTPLERNIEIMVTFLTSIHEEKSDLLNNMFQLYKSNFEMEKLMQMSLLRMLSVSEFAPGSGPKIAEHSTHHGVQ